MFGKTREVESGTTTVELTVGGHGHGGIRLVHARGMAQTLRQREWLSDEIDEAPTIVGACRAVCNSAG